MNQFVLRKGKCLHSSGWTFLWKIIEYHQEHTFHCNEVSLLKCRNFPLPPGKLIRSLIQRSDSLLSFAYHMTIFNELTLWVQYVFSDSVLGMSISFGGSFLLYFLLYYYYSLSFYKRLVYTTCFQLEYRILDASNIMGSKQENTCRFEAFLLMVLLCIGSPSLR